MTFESSNNPEQQSVDPSIKQEQIDRDFDAVLKEYQNMPPQEQAEFIEAIANKDPHFRELYTQLKDFFQERVMNLEDYDSHLKLEAVKKHIEGIELDHSKNESIRLEPNITDLENLKAVFYRLAPDNELHSKYFTLSSPDNQKLATIKTEFSAWIDRARSYIDSKYSAVEENTNITVENIESETETQEISAEELQELVERWEQELQRINEENNRLNEKIQSKVLQLTLIADISGMYKEYLQSLLWNITFKFASQKDERYETHIGVIENEIRNITNLTEYLNLLWNSEDLLNIDTEKLLDILIVSEEKLSDTMGYFDQPMSFLWNKADRISSVNAWYDNIKQTLSDPNISEQNISQIRLSIFDKIRSYDGLDDDKHIYNTSEGIRSRLSNEILNNPDLNQNETIKTSFDLIKNFSETDKQELYDSLNNWESSFSSFLETHNIFTTLQIENPEDYSEDLFDALTEGQENIDDNQLEWVLKKEIQSKITYLEKNLQNSKNKEQIQKQIDQLKLSINSENISHYLNKIKTEVVFKSLERATIFTTLDNNADIVKQIWENNRSVELYWDIEGVWSKLSDETFNSISSGTQFLAEQIAIMAISWWLGNLAMKWVSSALKLWEATSLLRGWMNLKNIWILWTNTVVEWAAFYGVYTWLNGFINEQEASQLFDALNWYDAVRTIIFLWVLRWITSLTQTTHSLNIKNVSLDTAAILWTDIIIRGTLWELLWKESIKWIDFQNPSASSLKEFWEFMVEELEFIVPLVIWLRLSDKAVATTFAGKENPKVEIIPKENEFIVKIEWLQKEIRVLKQSRNILRNKWKDISEINIKINEKKTEYKENREENAKLTTEKENSTVILENHQLWNKKEGSKKNNAKENVNAETGIASKYIKLEKYSKEAQSGKIDYALKDDIIWQRLTENWIWKNWENIWKWLLEKSWFKTWEKVEPKTKFEKNAVRQMEKANEVIYQWFLDLSWKIKEWRFKWEKINEILKWYSGENIGKIIKILEKGWN